MLDWIYYVFNGFVLDLMTDIIVGHHSLVHSC